MEADFWHKKWENSQLGFHESDTNPLLLRHFQRLNLDAGARIYLPLCGKTRDIAWLLEKGYQVVGVELSEVAVKQLFEELGAVPEVSSLGQLMHYHAESIDIYVGDIFDITADVLGSVDAIYDRAALVALPPEMRVEYTQHLRETTAHAKQLLICLQYDQLQMSGPPFSVRADEVRQHYAADYDVTQLEVVDRGEKLKGRVEVTEVVWLLV
ncbi:MAG: thiopurine S-methyltransferase [Proteobacteria bacterium]|nr:MAG: thiopurine S-methyltransferase [Pseudomonadota bacterium]